MIDMLMYGSNRVAKPFIAAVPGLLSHSLESTFAPHTSHMPYILYAKWVKKTWRVVIEILLYFFIDCIYIYIFIFHIIMHFFFSALSHTLLTVFSSWSLSL